MSYILTEFHNGRRGDRDAATREYKGTYTLKFPVSEFFCWTKTPIVL